MPVILPNQGSPSLTSTDLCSSSHFGYAGATSSGRELQARVAFLSDDDSLRGLLSMLLEPVGIEVLRIPGAAALKGQTVAGAIIPADPVMLEEVRRVMPVCPVVVIAETVKQLQRLPARPEGVVRELVRPFDVRTLRDAVSIAVFGADTRAAFNDRSAVWRAYLEESPETEERLQKLRVFTRPMGLKGSNPELVESAARELARFAGTGAPSFLHPSALEDGRGPAPSAAVVVIRHAELLSPMAQALISRAVITPSATPRRWLLLFGSSVPEWVDDCGLMTFLIGT